MGSVVIFVYRAVGVGLAIGVMELLAPIAHQPLSRMPFVTSIVLTLSLPCPYRKTMRLVPTRLSLGISRRHSLVSSCCGLFGPGETTSALGVGLAALMMLVLRAMHPPAGIDAFLIAGYDLPAWWILSPVLVGAGLLAVFSKLWSMGERYVRL